ncbi:unnamed protein product [Brassica napus]|uniref:(rape) hypothetical protein n=1 Tax=Brassica napus TaxID=3708 RepID=A0A816KIQ8_BRANA|nr:unnamed protein product [Brassica napus]
MYGGGEFLLPTANSPELWKSNVAAAFLKAGIRPTSPLHNKFSGMTLESSSTERNDDGRYSEYHPLPLPLGSPMSPFVVLLCSPSSPSSGVQGSSVVGGSEKEISKWKKGRFIGSGIFGKFYQGFNRLYHFEGIICAIKEVKVISDDKNSKECLKQLNQTAEDRRGIRN